MPDPQFQFGLPPEIQNLFQATELGGRQPTMVGKGSIIAFSYVGQTHHRIHDPYPLVLVSDVFTTYVRGVNAHYLTLPYVKGLIKNYANNRNFSYAFIKNDAYLVSSFRSYKRVGISQLKMLDAKFLQNLLKVARELKPGEIENIRAQIQKMMAEGPKQASANEVGREPI